MPDFQPLKGLIENLPEEKTEGAFYFTTDKGECYLDIDNEHRVQLNAGKLSKTVDGVTTIIEIEDIQAIQETVTNIEDKVEQQINSSILLTSGWNTNTYSLEAEYPNEIYNLEISLDSTATIEQANAFALAYITGNYSTNVLTALGTVPSIDIPVIIKAVKK